MSSLKVFIIQQENNEKLNPVNWENTQIISLDHPKYENIKAKFLLNQVTCELSQIQSIQHEKGCRSWFMGHEQVISDGTIFLATPYDITFIMLPLLERAQYVGVKQNDFVGETDEQQQLPRGKFIDEDQLLDQCFESNAQLISMLRPLIAKYKSIQTLCDTNDIPNCDDKVYRINEDLVLKWLSSKVDRISSALILNPSFIAANKKVQGFRKSMKTISDQNVSDEQLKRKATIQAFKILSDNVSIKWLKKLAQQLNLTNEVYPVRTGSSNSFATHTYQTSSSSTNSFDSPSTKRKRKNEDDEDGQPPSQKKRKPTISRAAASLAKVDKSKMKSITSFFSAKKKSE